MKTAYRIGRMLALAALLAAPVSFAGLYDAEKTAATGGDLADQDYWWTAYDMTMLDLALKQHQPEGHIGLNLASTLRRIDNLQKKYPNHAGIKAWKEKAESVNSQINPDADRGTPFKPGCPWDESNFGQAWVNWRFAQMLLAQKDEDQAFGLLQNVKQNFEILQKPGRLDDYPPDLRKWVTDTSVELNKIYPKLKEKTHH